MILKSNTEKTAAQNQIKLNKYVPYEEKKTRREYFACKIVCFFFAYFQFKTPCTKNKVK